MCRAPSPASRFRRAMNARPSTAPCGSGKGIRVRVACTCEQRTTHVHPYPTRLSDVGTAEPENIQPQNVEGPRAVTDSDSRYSPFITRQSAVLRSGIRENSSLGRSPAGDPFPSRPDGIVTNSLPAGRHGAPTRIGRHVRRRLRTTRVSFWTTLHRFLSRHPYPDTLTRLLDLGF